MSSTLKPDSLLSLKEEIRELARSLGATDTRIATNEKLAVLPSSDPTYVFPDARSVVSFAVPLGTDYIEDYLGKVTRMVFKRVLYEKFLQVGAIEDAIASKFKMKGIRAATVSPNAIFRSPEEGGRTPT